VYDLESEKVKNFLKEEKVKRVAVQLPAGLRPHLIEITETLGEAGVEAVVLADSCYGACDIADLKAKESGCDALIQYGHADMGLKTRVPTLYVEAHINIDPIEAVGSALKELEGSSWGLATTVQHIHQLPHVQKFLKENKIEAVIGGPGPRAEYPGQVLGCDWGCAKTVADKVDCILYIGTGRFHPLGISLATGKKVIAVNPVSKEFEKFDSDSGKFLEGRKAMLKRASVAEDFGVVTSSKPGQKRLKLARKIVEELRQDGLNAELMVAEEISPESIADYQVDALVCAACPRIPIDDADRFDIPILTPFEVRAMRGKADIEKYEMDEVRAEDV